MTHINREFLDIVKTSKEVYVMVSITSHEKYPVVITKAEALRIGNLFTDEDEPIAYMWYGSADNQRLYIG